MRHTKILRLFLLLAGYIALDAIQLAQGDASLALVNCGYHKAESCGKCGTPDMCNGDCVWKGSVCVRLARMEGENTLVRGQASCPYGWTLLATGCYRFLPAETFDEAKASCQRKGGYLVEIDNENENDILYQFYKDKVDDDWWVWLGATYNATEDKWIWINSGTTMTFTAWAGGQPNNDGNSNCVVAWPAKEGKFTWESISCFPIYTNRQSLCEYTGRSCFNNVLSNVIKQIEGCPTKIPIIEDGKILAGRIYREKGNDISALACNGACGNWYAETKFSQANGGQDPFGSIIINPGCTLYIFQDYNFAGNSKQYTGPALILNPPIDDPLIKDCGVPCISSMIWTCKQTYPSCTPFDSWQTVTELDNSGSSIPTTFSYEKSVGTSFSQSITESMSVSAEVSAEISAAFWGITATMGISVTTGYDWSKTDTETKSKIHTYTVALTIPAGLKVQIQEAVGTCGGSKIYTQMFRVLDTGATSPGSRKAYDVIAKYQGKIENLELHVYCTGEGL